ncbi:MAG TPA: D-glycero-beta-D-manno-heptose 1-phosphate adenylyltransferase [Caulobacteraceae bacterium]|jgi:D-beta-D-heptose 7-phosphate kinase/D-beta-D-heptose 1-phosphate adenosyltransferase|nr:D-glycero-beta-D-manno-heptose 1-phosphate adenylyltransferase [Caulobacteraceae bacterium]
MDLSALQQLLTAVRGVRVAAVGDLMVDRFVYGEVSRVSAEAPIPILARQRESVMLGAAGNVARNVAALGGLAALIGVVGGDGPAHEALSLIGEEEGIEGFLVTDPDRPTTVKTRFVSSGQQLLRVDLEEVAPLAGEVERRLLRTIRDAAAGAGAILLSDYGKGLATPAVIAACLEAAETAGAVLIVDSKARSFARYGEAAIVKPNAAELAYTTDMPTETDEEVEAALEKALSLNHCGAILVTRSAKGMSLARRGEPVRHFRRAPPEVFDTSGAGDTALAALGLALGAGATIEDAIDFALLASSVVVEKAGTATASPDELVEAELKAHQAPAEAKIATADRMGREVARWRERGLKVGFTNGCFDIIHPGHIGYLAQARAWCDRLIVGLNTDRSVRALKGAGRPVNDLESRALVLAGLASVDLVVPFDEDTPVELIKAARPDVLVKGADYTREGVVGHEIVEAYGGEVKLAPLAEGHSTTATIRRLSESA